MKLLCIHFIILYPILLSLFLESLVIWKDMLKSIEKEYNQGQKRLNGKHHSCVLSQFSNTKRKLMKSFVTWIQEGALLNKPQIVYSISKLIEDMMLLIDEVKRYHSSLFTSASSPKDTYKPAYVNIDSYAMLVRESLGIVKCLPEMSVRSKSMGKTALPKRMTQLATLKRYEVIKAFFGLVSNFMHY